MEILHEELRHREDLAAAWLFGSMARGTDSAGSDVDVAVLYRETPPAGFDGLPLDLEAVLERRLGRRVEVVVLNRVPCDLAHRVLREGLLLLDPDRSARIRFEVRTRNEYFDLLPVLRQYRNPAHDRP